MEGSSFPAVFSFKVGSDEFALAGRARAVVFNNLHPAVLNDAVDLLKIVFVIGDDANLSLGRKDVKQKGNEFILDKSALVVAFFRPGVGEINVHDGNGSRWNKLREEEDGFGSKGANIGALGPANAVRCVSPVPTGVFNADEIGVGVKFGLLKKKGSFAHADFKFDGVGVAEDFGEIQWTLEGLKRQANRFDNEVAVRLHKGENFTEKAHRGVGIKHGFIWE
jgi:hypothetical protein